MIAEKNKSFSGGSVFVNARAAFDGAPPLAWPRHADRPARARRPGGRSDPRRRRRTGPCCSAAPGRRGERWALGAGRMRVCADLRCPWVFVVCTHVMVFCAGSRCPWVLVVSGHQASAPRGIPLRVPLPAGVQYHSFLALLPMNTPNPPQKRPYPFTLYYIMSNSTLFFEPPFPSGISGIQR